MDGYKISDEHLKYTIGLDWIIREGEIGEILDLGIQ